MNPIKLNKQTYNATLLQNVLSQIKGCEALLDFTKMVKFEPTQHSNEWTIEIDGNCWVFEPTPLEAIGIAELVKQYNVAVGNTNLALHWDRLTKEGYNAGSKVVRSWCKEEVTITLALKEPKDTYSEVEQSLIGLAVYGNLNEKDEGRIEENLAAVLANYRLESIYSFTPQLYESRLKLGLSQLEQMMSNSLVHRMSTEERTLFQTVYDLVFKGD